MRCEHAAALARKYVIKNGYALFRPNDAYLETLKKKLQEMSRLRPHSNIKEGRFVCACGCNQELTTQDVLLGKSARSGSTRVHYYRVQCAERKLLIERRRA